MVTGGIILLIGIFLMNTCKSGQQQGNFMFLVLFDVDRLVLIIANRKISKVFLFFSPKDTEDRQKFFF